MQENSRSRFNDRYADRRNLNNPKRSHYQDSGRSHRTAPSDRPLLTHRDGKDSEQMLGMADDQNGTAKFMAVEDVSDSDEEQMDESDAEIDGVNPASEDGQDDETMPEPPTKRRALASKPLDAADGESVPRWSNPDPYTVLPPLDESKRKKKDFVKLIRKARKATEEKITEENQVIANDDFISFGFEEKEIAKAQEPPSSPSSAARGEYGSGVPGAPSAPRQFSHLQNLHNQDALSAPGTNGRSFANINMGPPPGLTVNLSQKSEEFVIDTEKLGNRNSPQGYYGTTNGSFFPPEQESDLGSRKRTRDDVIKSRYDRSGAGQKKTSAAHNSGSIIHEWIPRNEYGTDPTPWLRRSNKLTASPGFR